jgi:bifunctional DNA-binding transcriptional regulator/antitoxin component of YhaV-PrlF toxin-antitoxin module
MHTTHSRRNKMNIDLDKVSYIGETSVTIRKSRRRITIPKEVVESLGILDGDRVRWVLFNDNRLCITKVEPDHGQHGGEKPSEAVGTADSTPTV